MEKISATSRAMPEFTDDIELDFESSQDLGFDPTVVLGSVVELQINTPSGDQFVYLELFDAAGSADTLTSETAENFLNYVESGKYNGTIFHRSVPDFVLQGGGFSAPRAPIDEGGTVAPISVFQTIENQPGNSNLRGTVAMAKLGGDPDSATSQWFVNLQDNLFLNTQNEGFTVFGEVLGDGMDVVDQLASQNAYNFGGAFGQLPLWRLDEHSDGSIDLEPEDFLTIETARVVRDAQDPALTPEPTPADLNADGFVDDVVDYQMWTEFGGVELINRKGKTFSENSSKVWNATKAIQTDTGFSLLINHEKKVGKYKIWTANSDGLVTSTSKWKSGDQMMRDGVEDLFGLDLNLDSIIGKLPIQDLDNDGFVDSVSKYQIYSIERRDLYLRNKSGKRIFSDDTSRQWDAVKAVITDSSIQTLVKGTARKDGKFKIWSSNLDSGRLMSQTRWVKEASMVADGFEELLNYDINGNGVIGS